MTDREIWMDYKANGLKEANEHIHKLLCVNDKIGFAFGSNWTSEDVLSNKLNVNQEAVIYKTEDGGINWESTTFGKGVFKTAYQIQDTIFAIKITYFGEQVNEVLNSQIYVSYDVGRTWELLNELPYNINKVHFYTGHKGVFYAYNYKSNYNNYIFTTNNGGVSWDSLELGHKNMSYWTCSQTGVFHFLTTEKIDGQGNDILVRKDLTNGLEIKEVIPGFKANIVENDNHENLWFLGDKMGGVELWLRKEPFKYLKTKTFSSDRPLSGIYLYVYDNILVVILSELYKGHVKYKLYRSEDSGMNWVEELLPISYKVLPISFYKEDKIMMSIGGGRIQQRK